MASNFSYIGTKNAAYKKYVQAICQSWALAPKAFTAILQY